ncbi:hypothetical protein EAE96_003929 [Botrytis aclada]|nr:hypothetical protein EAE96_003929 [Botrytis aclada]
MSTDISRTDIIARDVASIEQEMDYFNFMPLNHPDRPTRHESTLRRLRELSDALQREDNTLETRIRRLGIDLSSLPVGGDRTQVMRNNFLAGKIDAEINVLRGQQQKLAVSKADLEKWSAELRNTEWA